MSAAAYRETTGAESLTTPATSAGNIPLLLPLLHSVLPTTSFVQVTMRASRAYCLPCCLSALFFCEHLIASDLIAFPVHAVVRVLQCGPFSAGQWAVFLCPSVLLSRSHTHMHTHTPSYPQQQASQSVEGRIPLDVTRIFPRNTGGQE